MCLIFTIASHINIIWLKILLPPPRGEQGATMLTFKRYAFDIKNLYAIENNFFVQMKEKVSANDMPKSANENCRFKVYVARGSSLVISSTCCGSFVFLSSSVRNIFIFNQQYQDATVRTHIITVF